VPSKPIPGVLSLFILIIQGNEDSKNGLAAIYIKKKEFYGEPSLSRL
jgi:hypothetical protein